MTHRRAVSPVIATVILIAVAVAIGIAVAFWASGLTTSFSKYEKLGINVGYANSTGTPAPSWTGAWYVITIQGSNSGSSAATIVQVQVNGVPTTFAASQPSSTPTTATWWAPSGASGGTYPVPSGGNFIIYVGMTGGTAPWTPGTTVEVALVTASGNQYPKAIVLP